MLVCDEDGIGLGVVGVGGCVFVEYEVFIVVFDGVDVGMCVVEGVYF